MAEYRKDLFKVGDTVIWDEEYDWITHGSIERLGKGPFQLSDVIDRQNQRDDYDGFGQSLWESMGHTQHVRLAEDSESHIYSGALFVLADPAARKPQP